MLLLLPCWASTRLKAFRWHRVTVYDDDEHTLHRQSILTLRVSTAGLGPPWQVTADDSVTTWGAAGNLHDRQQVQPQLSTFSKRLMQICSHWKLAGVLPSAVQV